LSNHIQISVLPLPKHL